MSDLDIPFTPAELAAAGSVTYPAKPVIKQFSAALDLRALAASTPPKYDFVVPGFLAGTVGALISPGGTGKSIFALQIAACIACAEAGARNDITGIGIDTPGRVIYLAGEDPLVALHHRWRDLMGHFGETQKEAIFDRIRLHPMVEAERDLLNDDWADWLITEASGARLIVIDTLRRFHTLDENDGVDAGRVMRRMERIAQQSGAALVFLHHVNKGSVTSGTADTQQAGRGSSVFTDDARWASFLSTMSKKEAEKLGVGEELRQLYIRWNMCKQNYSAPTDDLWFKRGNGGILTLIPGMSPIDAGERAERAWKENGTSAFSMPHTSGRAENDADARAYAVASNGGVSDEKNDFDF